MAEEGRVPETEEAQQDGQVAAEWRLEEMGVETDEDLLIVRRLVASGDRSRVYLNGSLSTLNSLKALFQSAPFLHPAPDGVT